MPLALAGLIFLIAVMAAEIAFMVNVADAIGILPTVLLLIGIGVVGTMLIRRQGLATLTRAHAALQQGRLPVEDLFEGACILAAGVMMALPGFLSDIVGCLLLLPPVRRLLYKALARRGREVELRTGPGGFRPGGRPRQDVIEGEYEEVEPVRRPEDERRPR
jgi:UPF0716 protein FxsA